MLHVRMGHVAHTSALLHIRRDCHIWMRHVAYTNAPYLHVDAMFGVYTWMSHVARMNAPCRTCECDVFTYRCHVGREVYI